MHYVTDRTTSSHMCPPTTPTYCLGDPDRPTSTARTGRQMAAACEGHEPSACPNAAAAAAAAWDAAPPCAPQRAARTIWQVAREPAARALRKAACKPPRQVSPGVAGAAAPAAAPAAPAAAAADAGRVISHGPAQRWWVIARVGAGAGAGAGLLQLLAPGSETRRRRGKQRWVAQRRGLPLAVVHPARSGARSGALAVVHPARRYTAACAQRRCA